jgi:hypothetical protein
MKATIKRLAIGFAVLATLTGGMIAQTQDASAKTRVFRSDDGKLTIVCVYDDVTDELAYCDVYWLGLADAGAIDAGGNGGTRLPASQIAVDGNLLAIDGGLVAGAPDGQLTADADDEPKKDRKGKKGHGGKHGKHGGKGDRR